MDNFHGRSFCKNGQLKLRIVSREPWILASEWKWIMGWLSRDSQAPSYGFSHENKLNSQKWIHAFRAAGGDRDHRHPRFHLVAGHQPGEAESQPGQLPEQHETNRRGLRELCA